MILVVVRAMARKIQERYSKLEAREKELKESLQRKPTDASHLFWRKFGMTPLEPLAKKAKGLLDLSRGEHREAMRRLNEQSGRMYLTHEVALLHLIDNQSAWLRPLRDWKPKGKSGTSQVSSLVQHLFCGYPVPFFLVRLWGSGGDSGRVAESMIISLGKGSSFSKKVMAGEFRHGEMQFPRLTKKQCHIFLNLKGEMSLAEALRTAQVRSCGGSQRLASEVAAAWPGIASETEEAFTAQLILWLCNQGMFDLGQVRPISDFIRDRRLEDPSWILSGRTFDSVLRTTQEWHKELQTLKKTGEWPSSGIPPYKSHSEEDFDPEEIWTCIELTSHKALSTEGRTMGHCVASYGQSASRGAISIWSLCKGKSKKLTIEAQNGSKTIIQARGKFNAPATGADMIHLKRWANQASLRLSSRL